jgi:hypothetical protein
MSSTNLVDLVKITILISVIFIAIKAYAILLPRRTTMLETQSVHQEKESKSNLPIRRKDSTVSQAGEPNERLQALKQELSHTALQPVYPWIAPPTPLPGPYDAPYYPLPLPSIRTYSDDAASKPTEETRDIAEETRTVSYTRRESNSTPDQEPTIRGTVTVSNHGWRRTQWTVSKG